MKVLDLGCGTGMIGEHLSQKGFKNIIGCDLSQGMMGVADKKGCYSELVEFDINNIDDFPQKWKNGFDIVVCSGMINNNHMDWRLFEEMVLGCK